MSVRFRSLLLAAACLASPWLAAPAAAQEPIRIVIGFAAGGALDALARGLAEQLTASLGEPVIVDNRPGASTMVSIDYVKRAPADGRTVLLASLPPFVIFPMSYSALKYDYDTDFRPVAHVAYVPTIISTGAQSPYRSFTDYIAAARKDPAQRAFGLTSLGGGLHFSVLALGKEAGVPLSVVNYKGGAPLVTDIAGGHVPVGTDALGSQLELHKAGKVRIIAVGGTQRLKWLPDVPTVHELGFKAFDNANATYAAFVRAGTPDASVKKLEAALVWAARSPAIAALLDRVGMQPTGEPAERVAAQVKTERAFWKPVVEASGFKADQ